MNEENEKKTVTPETPENEHNETAPTAEPETVKVEVVSDMAEAPENESGEAVSAEEAEAEPEADAETAAAAEDGDGEAKGSWKDRIPWRDGKAEKKIKELEEKVKEAEKQRLLALAEMDNQRKRLAREMDNLRFHVTQDTVFPFLQVFDHFTMAVTAAQKSGTLEALLKGMEMIQNEFDKAFGDLGIEKVDAVGKKFDPALHEAVAEEASETVPAGTVIRQWCMGYKSGSKLLKPAMVVVSSGPAAKEEDSAEAGK